MKVTAQVRNGGASHDVSVSTAGQTQHLAVPAMRAGRGSAVNGGEFLMLALATCYCNDLYREAARLGLTLDAVEVEAEADFDGVGLSAANVRYRARVQSAAPAEQIAQLLRETDAVAEVHNTLRSGVEVTLENQRSASRLTRRATSSASARCSGCATDKRATFGDLEHGSDLFQVHVVLVVHAHDVLLALGQQLDGIDERLAHALIVQHRQRVG